MCGAEACADAARGALDGASQPCNFYEPRPQRCGRFDDDDFTAAAACCACGGGTEDCAADVARFSDLFLLLGDSGPPAGAAPCERHK